MDNNIIIPPIDRNDYEYCIDYPIVTLVGDRGDGKTLTATTFAYWYSQNGFNVYANYNLYNIAFEYVDFGTLAEFPDDLHDGVVIMDEAHIGADAYASFTRLAKDITKFATQLRKRNLTLILTTQVFDTMAKRLRLLTNYIFECNKTNINGIVTIHMFDRSQVENAGYVNTITIDGRPFFDYYDTNQIIENNEE